ncbi:hypothetical protein [Streptomyces sp. WM6378]|uniref:hypothetical protein n=1 Tax=Streptomyces sp. WM6378 TaxID=1415557 RepID=UPI0006B04263|nr:hypothetical protein [Streptomyces sp. WM6378]KOU34887.1 hypothetical protein ADK54_39675 [Streptomyces sp. WM6378]
MHSRRLTLPGTVLVCLVTLAACDGGNGGHPAQSRSATAQPQPSGGPGTCDETKPSEAGPWKSVLAEFRDYLKLSGASELTEHVKDAKLRDCPGGDREANVLTDYDPHLEAPNMDAETKQSADRVAHAFTTWRDEKFHDEGWVYVINGAVETVTKRPW